MMLMLKVKCLGVGNSRYLYRQEGPTLGKGREPWQKSMMPIFKVRS